MCQLPGVMLFFTGNYLMCELQKKIPYIAGLLYSQLQVRDRPELAKNSDGAKSTIGIRNFNLRSQVRKRELVSSSP